MQKLIEFRWDEKSVEDALITAKRRYSDVIKQVSQKRSFLELNKSNRQSPNKAQFNEFQNPSHNQSFKT